MPSKRKDLASAVTKAAEKVESLATNRPTYHGTVKDASHASFYTGTAKGVRAAVEGVVLFLSHKELRQKLSSTLVAQLVYVALATVYIVFLRPPAADVLGILWSLSRWCRLLTMVVTIVVDCKLKPSEVTFKDSLHARNAAFAEAVFAQPRAKRRLRDRARKLLRVAKLAALRMASCFVSWYFPGGSMLLQPVLQYISLRPVLGMPVAVAVSSIYALPQWVLSLGHADDILLSLSEAVVDAQDFGMHALRVYNKRLDAETQEYFRERYRGYVTGLGAFYCLLQAIPFAGVTVVLIAECGAACLIEDIVARNLSKSARKELCGESAFLPGGHDHAS